MGPNKSGGYFWGGLPAEGGLAGGSQKLVLAMAVPWRGPGPAPIWTRDPLGSVSHMGLGPIWALQMDHEELPEEVHLKKSEENLKTIS